MALQQQLVESYAANCVVDVNDKQIAEPKRLQSDSWTDGVAVCDVRSYVLELICRAATEVGKPCISLHASKKGTGHNVSSPALEQVLSV